MDRTYIQRDAKGSKETEDFYPQLLGSMMIVDPPKWVFILWKVMKPFFPRRLIEKINFASSKKSVHIEGYYSKYISKSNLPKVYGGDHDGFPTAATETFGRHPEIFESQQMYF